MAFRPLRPLAFLTKLNHFVKRTRSPLARVASADRLGKTIGYGLRAFNRLTTSVSRSGSAAMRSRGRSIVEVIVAVTFVGFLTGFVAVLCIGNYFRARRAMERQRQRRLAGAGSSQEAGSHFESPRSQYSTGSSLYSDGGEQRRLLDGQRRQQNSSRRPTVNGTEIEQGHYAYPSQQYRRRQQHHEQDNTQNKGEEDLLRFEENVPKHDGSDVMSV